MKRDSAVLDKALRTGDTPAVIAFFRGLTEDQRKPYADQVAEWLAVLETNRKARLRPEAAALLLERDRLPYNHELGPTAYVAVLACGTFAQVKAGVAYIRPDTLRDLLADRRPAWTQAFADHMCSQRFGWCGPLWLRVRELILAGLCVAPAHENYILGGIEGVFEMSGRPGYGRFGPEPAVIANRKELERIANYHRDWFEGPFWRLFELEGYTQISLAARQRYSAVQSGWIGFLIEMNGHPLFPRERLLDESLAALNRGFLQFRSGWFSRFHEALKPTIEERVARVDAYLSLLGSAVPPTVTFALDALASIVREKPLPPTIPVSALEPALRSRTKKSALAALSLLKEMASRDSRTCNMVCLSATEAILSDHAEAQASVLKLLQAHGDPHSERLRARLAEISPALRPSLKARFDVWLAPDTTLPPAAPTAASDRSVAPTHAPIKPTDASRALTPISTLDELIDQAAAVLESPIEIDEVERVLDGIARLGGQRPDDFDRRVMPLAKRAVDRLQPRSSSMTYSPLVEQSLAYAIVSWLGNRNYVDDFARGHERNDFEPTGFLLRRLAALATQVIQHRALPLLSAPTHQGGWIEPTVLVERWRQWQEAGVEPDRLEQVLGLLRLAPEGRDVALAAARSLHGEAGRLVCHALGQPATPGTDAALWLAAYRSYQPHGDLPEFERVHPKLGPGAGKAPRYTVELPILAIEPELPDETDPALLPALLNQLPGRFDWHWRSRPLLRWTASLWPGNRDAFFFRAIAALEGSLGWSEASDREAIGYLEPLADPTTELSLMACHALALGLGAKDSSLRAQAQDALIGAITHDRLPLNVFATALASLFTHAAPVRSRWAKVFAETYRVSPAHADALARTLPLALPPPGGPVPRELGAYLDVMLEILSAANVRIEHAHARTYLSALTGTGRVPKLAGQLLKL